MKVLVVVACLLALVAAGEDQASSSSGGGSSSGTGFGGNWKPPTQEEITKCMQDPQNCSYRPSGGMPSIPGYEGGMPSIPGYEGGRPSIPGGYEIPDGISGYIPGNSKPSGSS